MKQPKTAASGPLAATSEGAALHAAAGHAAAQHGGAIGDETLRQVAELNLQGVRLLRAALDAGGELPVALAAQRGAWRALDAPAQQRLAACPWLLFDVYFDDVHRWRRALQLGVHEDSPGTPLPFAQQPALQRESLRFTRVVINYAWHLARAAPLAATVVLGMPAETRELLRAQGLPAIDAIAAETASGVRLRWEHLPVAWAGLLRAAAAGDPVLLHNAQLHGLQRIAGACRAAAGRGGGL